MEYKELDEMFNLISDNHGKWWNEHHSRREVLLGTIGVGHDRIHPADKLSSAFMNAWGMCHTCIGLQEKLEEAIIEYSRSRRKLEILQKNRSNYTECEQFENLRLAEIDEARKARAVKCSELSLKDRRIALDAMIEAIKELLPIVQQLYINKDEALDDIWTARLAYAAGVKNHPLGQEIKVALLPENKKQDALNMIDFPLGFPVPNADYLLKLMEGLTNGKDLLS